MKKKSLKNLKLNKKSISKIDYEIKGGEFPTLELNSICNFCETDLVCPSWACSGPVICLTKEK